MKVETLIDKASKQELWALGLTDTGNMFGAMEFSLAAAKAGVKPILGTLLPLYIEPLEERGLAPEGHKVFGPFMLPIFVQNEQGFQNLSKLLTQTTLDQQPQWTGGVHRSQLQGLTEGLISLSGGVRGPLSQLYAQGIDKAEAWLKQMAALFPNRFYVELERTRGRPTYEDQLIDWAFQHSCPLVATNEAFFFTQEDYAAHDALLCVKESTYVNEQDRRRETPENYLKSAEEMTSLFADVPEALENTQHIAKRCSLLIQPKKPTLPPYPVTKGQMQQDVLQAQAQSGLNKRLEIVCATLDKDTVTATRATYQKQLDHELSVIHQMGFDGYFLIVADFIQWAKSEGIPVGPGRGSGAGSLVAWSLMITDVDPIHFKLLFERFLNPERVSMPDFDIDFCPERRNEVIHYVENKYGKGTVAHIITFGKLQARAVLRDVGRVLGMPYGQVDKLTKRIPFNPANPVTLSEVLAGDEELRKMCEEEAAVKRLFDFAVRLEGLYRHASTHAAGIVIGDKPLVERLPLYKDPNASLPATGFSMKYVELMGLVKFDFLGLKTLTVLQESEALVRDGGHTIDLAHIPLDDAKTFALLREVRVIGLFQLESPGMRDVLRQLQPDEFEEIIALVALYRPGPMDDIPYYLACKHGREKVTYPYACLEDILKKTFGVMVYQEQVLQIAQRLAGYSLGQADILRRAMGKKIKSEMNAQRKIFIAGVLKNAGGSEEKATKLFDQIAKFAGYAFVRAHATPYALISYQTAYMKANYPLACMIASMNQDRNNTDRLALFVREARDMGLTVLPPDINASGAKFGRDQSDAYALRYGLGALKNVGEGAMETVVKERKTKGPFSSIYDFVERLGPSRVLNKRQLEHLIWAGAFDSLGEDRRQLAEHVEILVKYGMHTDQTPGLFQTEDTRPKMDSIQPYTPTETLRNEHSAVGFYLTVHPLEPFAPFIGSTLSSNAMGTHFITAPKAKMAGVLLSAKVKMGKSGKKYAFLQFSDLTGVFEGIMFEDVLAPLRNILETGKLFQLSVTGRVENDSTRLVIEGATPFDDLFGHTSTLCLLIAHEEIAQKVAKVLESCKKGHTAIRLLIPNVPFEGEHVDVHAQHARAILLDTEALSVLVATGVDIRLADDVETGYNADNIGRRNSA